MSKYAIGDIHGCRSTFQALLEQLPLQPGDTLILLGDLIDRGPDSKGVIDFVFDLREKGHTVVCLRGNHEQLLLDALLDKDDQEIWLFNGGRQTLESFGASSPQDIPKKYLDFFLSMPYWYETGQYLCVHGGLDFSRPDPLKRPDTLLWMRGWHKEIDYEWLGNRIVLHGHTPTELEYIQEQHKLISKQQYLNLDNGCVYAYMKVLLSDMGRLLAFSLDSGKLIAQVCVD